MACFSTRSSSKYFVPQKINESCCPTPMKKKCNFEGCDKSFTCNSRLQDHMNAHLGLRPFECNICQKNFYSKKLLLAHNESHSRSPAKCPQCNASIAAKTNIKRHMNSCLKVYVCELCGKKYRKKFYYERHILNHPVDKTKTDDSSSKPPYKRIRRKRSEIGRVEICKICKAEYKGLRNLKAHHRSVHEKYRFQCNLCDKNFSHNVSLRKHIAREHQKPEEEKDANPH